MLAEVTYNGGKTYRLKQYKFSQGKTVLVSDAAIIKRCRATAGFAVQLLDEKQAKESKAKPVETVATVGSKVRPKKVAKKTTAKRVKKPVPDWANEETKAKSDSE